MMDQEKAPLRTALVYDFDGTLAPGNIQEHSLLPKHLGLTGVDFWKRAEELLHAIFTSCNEADST